MDLEQIKKAGLEAGFSHVGYLDCSTLKANVQVREMCADGKCGQYGTNWACPPACGTIEECQERMSRFRWGVLVQTVGDLEDEMDGEGMMEAQAAHKEHFQKLLQVLRKEYPKLLALGAGTCQVCPACAYPDAPCRFPDKAVSSMEAYGILVLEACQKNQMEYYYGKDHIAYTSCILLE